MNIGLKQTKLRQSLRQAGLFACVGVLAVLFDFVVYTSLIKSIGLTSSKILGFYGGVIVSFLGNSLLTFRKVNQPPLQFSTLVRYVTVSTMSMALNAGTNLAAITAIQMAPFSLSDGFRVGIAFCCATGVSMSANFLSYKYWVYR